MNEYKDTYLVRHNGLIVARCTDKENAEATVEALKSVTNPNDIITIEEINND